MREVRRDSRASLHPCDYREAALLPLRAPSRRYGEPSAIDHDRSGRDNGDNRGDSLDGKGNRTMKITKRGTPPEDGIWDGLCFNCRTEVEAEEKELRSLDPDAFDQLGNTTRLIEKRGRCPVCGLNTMVLRPRPKPTRIEDEVTIRSDKSSTPDHGFGDY